MPTRMAVMNTAATNLLKSRTEVKTVRSSSSW